VADGEGEDARSAISGGIQHGPVLQGRDFINPTFVTHQAATAPVARAQLPALATGFIGRESELAQLAGLLNPARDTGAVVVSAVAGLAGVGKTGLAIQAAHAAREAGWFPGGVLFIDLHGYDDAPVQPGQALDSLLRALGVPAEQILPSAEDRAGFYRSVLAQIADPVLVIADNASSEAQVRPLLPGPGPHRVIVTSRYTLAGLGTRLLDVTALDQQAGVALLDAALRVARPGDTRVSSEPVAAGRLAGICGGLPRALRIAAARLAADATLSVAELAGELSEINREAARRLNHRRNEAVELDNLGIALRELRRFEEAITAHQEAAAICRETGDRHREAMALTNLGLAQQELRRFEEAITAHQEAAAIYRETRDRDGEAMALTNLGLALWDVRLFDEAITAHQEAAAIFQAAGDRHREAAVLNNLGNAQRELQRFDEAITAHQEAAAIYRETGDRHGEAAALSNLGIALQELRRFEEAITAHQEAAAICREAGDRHHEAMALNNLGIALQEVRRFDEAITAHQEAAAIYREAGDRHRVGTALNNLGLALRKVRRFDEAISAHQEAAVIFGETGDRHLEANALANLKMDQQRAYKTSAEAAQQQSTASLPINIDPVQPQ
jgi:tetratricopeptide (TPR) repeat protein